LRTFQYRRNQANPRHASAISVSKVLLDPLWGPGTEGVDAVAAEAPNPAATALTMAGAGFQRHVETAL